MIRGAGQKDRGSWDKNVDDESTDKSFGKQVAATFALWKMGVNKILSFSVCRFY